MKGKNPRPKKQAPKPVPVERGVRHERVTCPVCNGEGFYGSTVCEKCEGNGQILRKLTRPEGAPLPKDNGNHGGGRTPKYTPEMMEQAAECISRGMTYKQTAGTIGVATSTLEEWIKDEGEFSGAIKKAVGERTLARLRYVEGGNENWQAVAWCLERTCGNQFAPPKTTVRQEHTFKDGVDDKDLEELDDMLGLM